MKLKLKEDPKEWRKITLMSAFALVLISTILHWRHRLPTTAWLVILSILAAIMVCACVQPAWFRSYYRGSSRLGFYLSQWMGYVVLTIVFWLVFVPLGFALRLAGKDPLRLKRSPNAATYWNPAKKSGPLDRLF